MKRKLIMVSFANDIRPLFRQEDLDCMSDFGVELGDYAYMSDSAGGGGFADHGNARAVHYRLTPAAGGSRMPEGGPYWLDAQIALYEQWMIEGFPP
jgi:hypothetical protein